jgi:hypothetical protein
MFCTWFRTVAGLTWRRPAIVFVSSPAAIKRKISSSRRVSSLGGSGAAGVSSRSWTRLNSALIAVAEQVDRQRLAVVIGCGEDADVQPHGSPCLRSGLHVEALDGLAHLHQAGDVTALVTEAIAAVVASHE